MFGSSVPIQIVQLRLDPDLRNQNYPVKSHAEMKFDAVSRHCENDFRKWTNCMCRISQDFLESVCFTSSCFGSICAVRVYDTDGLKTEVNDNIQVTAEIEL